MTNMEAIDALVKHVRECGMLMPMDWVKKNGDGSPFMEAIMMAVSALKEGIDTDE
jgi:hypothetical protein